MKNSDELKKMRSDAQKTVAGFVATATASCAVPIPIADAVILVGEQVTMMGTISAIYKLGLKKKTLQALVMGALGASGVSVVGKTVVSSVFKLMPGLGTAAGSVISASTAAMLTLVLGNAFIELCEAVKSGELTEEDLEGKKGRDYFKELFNLSKKEKEIDGMSCEESEKVDEDEELNTKKEMDFLKIEFAGLEDLGKMCLGDTPSVNMKYESNIIGNMRFETNESGKIILKEIYIREKYQGMGLCSYAIEYISGSNSIEIAKEAEREIQDLD